jgi:DNA-binding IclR family transcriptional regulator
MATLTYRHVPAVDKAARLLAALRGGESVGISELARRIGASKGTVRDVLLTLAAHDLVVREPDGRFHVELGRGGLRDLAHDSVVSLARESGETAFLGVVDRDAIVIADVVESRTDPHMSARVGWRVPAGVGAHAKVLGKGEPVGLDDEEYLAGVRAAAAPILDATGRRVAVLLVVGMKSRVTLARLRRLGKIVASHANEVSARLRRRAA